MVAPKGCFLSLIGFFFIAVSGAACAPNKSGGLQPTSDQAQSAILGVQTQLDASTGVLSATVQIEGEADPVVLTGVLGKDLRATLRNQNQRPILAEAYCLDPLNCTRTLVDVYFRQKSQVHKRQFASENLARRDAVEAGSGPAPAEYVGFPLSSEAHQILGLPLESQTAETLEKKWGPWLQLREGGVAVGPAQTVKSKAPDGTETLLYGSLQNATALTEISPYLRKVSSNFYGTGFMVSLLQNSAVEMGKLNPGGEPILVGSIAKQQGGLFPPHKSHQNGLDADVLFMGAKDWTSVVENGKVTDRFDAQKNWDYWRLLYRQKIIEDGKPVSVVSMILVDPVIKNHLCVWAQEKGMLKDPENLEIMQKVRPTEGHDDHFHLRLKCSPHHPLCRKENIKKSDCAPGTP